MMLSFIEPSTTRTLLIVFGGGIYLIYHLTRLVRHLRLQRDRDEELVETGRAKAKPVAPAVASPAPAPLAEAPRATEPEAKPLAEPTPAVVVKSEAVPEVTPEEVPTPEAERASELPTDPPQVLAQRGDFARERGAWVEAYYWMWLAKRAGMRNLASVMREIRLSWAAEGYPDEAENIYELFSEEQASIARALISVESGHEATAAREYLKTYHPEFC